MPPVPVDEFVREFRALSASERTAFVANLWDARGWATTVEDDVVAERDGERRRIRVVDPGRFGTPNLEEADTLVAARDREAVREAAREAGVEYFSPRDLYDLLLYGIERETARDLYASTFGQSLERAPPEPESGDEGAGTVRDSDPIATASAAIPTLSGNRRAIAALLLLVLVGVAVVGPPLPATAPDQQPVTVGDVTAGDVRTGAIGGASPSPTESPALLPGVTREGVVDARTLGNAHVANVQNRSRVQRVTMTGPPNTSVMGGASTRNQTLRAVNGSYYRFRSVDRISGETEWTRQFDVYADGEHEYWRIAMQNETHYSRYTDEARSATRFDDPTGALYRYFAGANDTVVSCAIEYETDCPTYRIEVDGDPPAVLEGHVEDYQALAIVSDRGVITTIRVNYTLPDRDDDGEREQVRYALDYQFEPVDVTAPEWLSEAQNETTGTETAATPSNTTDTSTEGTTTATPSG